MLSTLTTNFISRLRDQDQAAWFELWQTFSPVLRAQLTKWGKGRIGHETVRDLSQETLANLSGAIDRFDPTRGVRFSTWLLAIAKHTLSDEMDRRGALKRGGGKPNLQLQEGWMHAAPNQPVDAQYEAAVFRAKVEAAIRLVERRADFTEFSIYRMRVLDGQSGKDVAVSMGTSEPTVSRRVAKIRAMLREALLDTIATYSFTPEEIQEGAQLTTEKADDALFDEAIAEIYYQQMQLRADDEAELTRQLAQAGQRRR